MNIVESKIELRKKIKIAKSNLAGEQKNIYASDVFQKVENLDVFKNAKCIFCYWSLPDELSTINFINKWYLKKKIFLPKVIGNDLALYLYRGGNSLEKGSFGIMEPVGLSLDDFDIIDLSIVPGIAFSNDGFRLGRGGGYYDRFLPLLKNSFNIGVGYGFQIFSEIPMEKHDIKLDMII